MQLSVTAAISLKPVSPRASPPAGKRLNWRISNTRNAKSSAQPTPIWTLRFGIPATQPAPNQDPVTAPAIISNFGEITLVRCELSFNTINASQNAGTIINYGFADIRNTRIRGNIVSRRFQSLVLASALLNYGKAELQYVTLSDNEAIGGFPSVNVSGVALAFVNQGIGTMKVSGVTASNNLPAETF